MTRLRFLLVQLALVLVARGHAFAAPSGAETPAATLGVDEIRPGMTGIGKTVFQGTRIEEFQVEILGVMKRVSPGGDMILGRMSGGPLAVTGIIQGMSGSPVYVDGKLIGAVAFAWPFAKEPIAGITPIGEMIDVIRRKDAPPDRVGAGGDGSEANAGGDGGGEEVAFTASGPWGQGARFSRIQTPISVSGFDPRVVDRVLPWLEGFGFAAAPGGAGPSSGEVADSPAYDPVPGAAVGVQLLSGDAAITAFGTVTYREGDRLVAFGHPFLQGGDIELPMSGAYIHTVMPSGLASFKMGSPLTELGTMTQDRRVGVAGRLGPRPVTIPVAVTVTTPDETRPYHYQIVSDKRLTPGLVRYAAMNSVLAREPSFAEQTVRTRTVIRLTGGRSVTLENLFAGFSGVDDVVDEVSEPAAIFLQNRFEPVGLEGIDVEIGLEPGRHAGRLEAITLARNPVRPGETVRILATVRPYQGPDRVVPIEVVVPAGTPDGELALRVCDAGTLESADEKRAPLRNEVRSLDAIIDRLSGRRQNNRLYAQLEEPSVGVTISGREMPAIPRSRFAVIDSPRHAENAGVSSSSLLAETAVEMEMVITGCSILPIYVDSRAR